jgi:hypothetical protein
LRKYVFYLLWMRSPGDLHNNCAHAVLILRMPIGALSKPGSESSLYAAGNWWSKITAQSVIYCTIYCTKSPYCVRFHPKLCNPCRLKLLKPNGAAKVGRFSRPPVSTAHTSLRGSVINSLTAVRHSQNRWSFRPPVQSLRSPSRMMIMRGLSASESLGII